MTWLITLLLLILTLIKMPIYWHVLQLYMFEKHIKTWYMYPLVCVNISWYGTINNNHWQYFIHRGYYIICDRIIFTAISSPNLHTCILQYELVAIYSRLTSTNNDIPYHTIYLK